MRNRQYAIWTAILVVALLGWLAYNYTQEARFSPSASAADTVGTNGAAGGAEQAAETPAEHGHPIRELIVWGLFIAAATGAIIVLAWLQRRRFHAFKEAAKRDKQQTRAAQKPGAGLEP